MSPRDRILARRAKFVAAALGSLGAAGVVACAPEVCLEYVEVDSGAPDTGRADAPSDTRSDTGPNPCLAPDAPPKDSGSDTAVTDSADTGPMPCLIPPEDTG